MESASLAAAVSPCGLKNQGATDYVNVIVQALYSIPEIRQLIFQAPISVGIDVFMLHARRLRKRWRSSQVFSFSSLKCKARKAPYGTSFCFHINEHHSTKEFLKSMGMEPSEWLYAQDAQEFLKYSE
jgi:ubiquitin C-terminal hydrolase